MAATTAMIGFLQGCDTCSDDRWQPSRSIDLGVSSDLHAVVASAELGHSAIAVGSAGLVVAWGNDTSDAAQGNASNEERLVETSTVVDVDLWGVTDAGGGRWVVVGDGGFAASSDNYGQTWTTLDLQTSANLHAAVTVRESVVVGGDGLRRGIALEQDAQRDEASQRRSGDDGVA